MVRLNRRVAACMAMLCILFLSVLVSACVPVTDTVAQAPSAAPIVSKPAQTVLVDGGAPSIQHWTAQAAEDYCRYHRWPHALRHVAHVSRLNHPLFNQPRKTHVIVAHDNTLHIHFQLGGVLMSNYTHELIIAPPNHAVCTHLPMRYIVSMQPSGNSVLYKSEPIVPNKEVAHVSKH